MRFSLFSRANGHAGLVNTAVDAGDLTIRVVRASAQTMVSLTGRVTVDSSPQLRSVLLGLLRRGAKPLVVIDFSGVSYLDMSGLATLFEALEAAQRWSLKLRVVGISGQARTFAEVAELDKIFHVVGSEVEYR